MRLWWAGDQGAPIAQAKNQVFTALVFSSYPKKLDTPEEVPVHFTYSV